MRFFRAIEDLEGLSFHKTTIEKGSVICFSKYFDWDVLVSDGTQKTEFIWMSGEKSLESILNGKLIPLTQKELDKIKPHLKKEHFGRDWDYSKQFNFRHK